jgi:hypothetical protein
MDPEYDYHGDYDNKSKSMISLFLKSPMDYHLTFHTREMKPKAPKKPMIIGTIGHAVLMERRKLNQLAVIYPASCLNKNGDINPTPAEKFRNECEGYFCLKPSEYQYVDAALKGMEKHLDFMKLVDQATSLEEPYFAELFGLPCKCKPDILCDIGDMIVIHDPKFMPDISPPSFWRSAKLFDYWLQQAHYSTVVQKHFGKPVLFRFRAIETKFPFRQQPYCYEGIDLENIMGTYEQTMLRLKERYDSGNWEDAWEGKLRFSPWDGPAADEMEVPFDFDADNASDDVQF